MTRIQTQSPLGSPLIRVDSAMQVRVKKTWADSWKTVRFLDPISSEMLAGPGIGQAQLRYMYGRIAQPGHHAYEIFKPLDLAGNFIQIKTVSNSGTSGGRIWHGVATSEQFAVDGADSSSGGSGIQTITAMELGHILGRKTLRGASFDDAGIKTLGILPTFNRSVLNGQGRSLLGNRSDVKFSIPSATEGAIDETFIFSDFKRVWSNYDILEYVLGRYIARGLPFRITGQFAPLLGIEKAHAFNGLDIHSVINILIDKRRGLGWNISTNGSGVIDLHVSSVLEAPISVGDVTVPANPDIIDNIVLDDDRGVSAAVQRSSDGQFGTIIVEGGRLLTCFSCSLEGANNLEEGWATSEEVDYKIAISPDTLINDKYRKTDQYKRVYEHFRVPRDWSGEGDVAPPGIGANALPTMEPNGTLDVEAVAPIFMLGKSFERALPIPKQAAVAGAEPEFLEPFAIVRDTQVTHSGLAAGGSPISITLGQDASSVNSFYNGQLITLVAGAGSAGFSTIIDSYNGGTRIAVVADAWGDGDPDDTTAYEITSHRYIPSDSEHGMVLRMADSEMGVMIEPQINHILGLNHFDSETFLSGVEPVYDYLDLIFTVALKTDQVATVIAGKSDGSAVQSLTIGINDAEMHYVVPGTVVGIDSNGDLVRSTGGLIRDDSERLRQVAAMAFAWYGTQRSTLDMGWARITQPGAIGSLVRTVSDSFDRKVALTVITSVRHVFTAGAQETRISTSFAGMNFPSASRETTAMQGALDRLGQRVGNMPVRYGVTGLASGGTGETINNRIAWNEDSAESG